MAAAVGLGVFIESTITCLVVGTLARPFFDRHRMAREKLAYICDATSAPVCMLIPLNSWGAVVLALLAAQAELGRLGDRSPLGVFLAAAPLNFYALLSVLLVFAVAATGYDMGPMRDAERRARQAGTPDDEAGDAHPPTEAAGQAPPGAPPRAGGTLREAARGGAPYEASPGAAGRASYESGRARTEDGGADDRPASGRARHLAVPLAVMMGTVLAGIAGTGIAGARAAGIADPGLMDWLEHASGSTAVLAGVLAALAVLAATAIAAGDARPRELADAAWRGAASMAPIASLLVLALAIGGVCEALGTGPFIADRAAPLLTPALAAPVVFLTSGSSPSRRERASAPSPS